MATKLYLDPELAAIVDQARRRAAEAGELRPPRIGPYESTLPPEAREIVTSWLRDGGYDEAIAAIAADDPELAN